MVALLRNLNPRQTFFKNTIWLFAGQALYKLSRVVLIFGVARLLGPSGYGSFAYAFSIAALFFSLADWGISMLVVRDYQKTTDVAPMVRAALALKLLFLGASTVVSIWGWYFLHDPAARRVYIFLVILMVFTHLRDFSTYLVRAVEQMEREFVISVVDGVATFIAALGLLFIWRDVVAVGLGYVIGMVVSGIVAVYLARHVLPRPLLAWDPPRFRYFARNGMPLALFGLLTFFFFSTDQIVLGYFRTPAEVGFYALAVRVIMIALVLPQVLLTALFPYLSRIAADRRRSSQAFWQMLGALTGIAVVVALATQFLAPIIFPLVSGADYLPSVPILTRLMWVVVFAFPVTFLDYFLITRNRQLADLLFTIIAVAMNVVLNLVLVPRYGASGAVTATLTSQGANLAITFLLSMWVLKRAERAEDIRPLAPSHLAA